MTDSTIPRRRSSRAPLSFGQELLWMLDRASPGLTAYNVPRGFRIGGRFDAEAMGRALNQLIERHEVLRSGYEPDGDAAVQVPVTGATVPLEILDRPGLPPAERAEELARIFADRANHRIDLAREIPLQATVVRFAEDDHGLFLLSHHIVFDGWSRSILFRDLTALYRAALDGRPAGLAPLPIQYADYACWERERAAGPEIAAQLDYWRGQLGGPLPVLDLPTDRPRPSGEAFEGDARYRILPTPVAEGLRRLGQAHGASLYMTLLAAWQTLLHRYSGQDEIIVGSPIAGRTDEATEDLIGYFANALVLRTSFGDDPTFADLLKRVASTCLDAFEHQEVPLERLVLELQKGQQLTHAPLFQVVLTMEDTVPAELRFPGATIDAVDVVLPSTKFDLTLLFSERPEGLRLALGFRTALFDGERIERMLGHLETLIQSAISTPATRVSALPILTAAERQQLAQWNATDWSEGPDTTVPAMIERHAARVPNQEAVRSLDQSLSWSALNGLANRIGHWLVSAGVAPGDRVALCLDRSVEMIAGMLGTMKAGAAYVALVPDLPPARLAQQLGDSGAKVVLTTTSLRTLLPPTAVALALDDAAEALSSQPSTNLDGRSTPDGLAYVLFTSGSTGVPKGVAVTQANLVHYTRAIARELDLDLDGSGQPWHCASVSTLGADLGHTAIFPALCSGGTLHVLPASVATDPGRYAEYVATHPLDLLKITPSHFRALISGAEGADLAARIPRRWLVLGGEACPWDLADLVQRAGRGRVLNHYGPTETTVGVCTFRVEDGNGGPRRSATVPIGRPLANTVTYVVDRSGELAPVGVPGELLIGGLGVTIGYLNRTDLTAERFIPNRYAAGGRLYRTGDRVRRLPTGEIEFLGRIDDQVKIRGHRVEPGEVESLLAHYEGVRQAAVITRRNADGEAELVAYLAAPAELDTKAVATWLGEQVPDYMRPVRWVRLDGLPLNSNGKVDRRALPEADDTTTTAFAAPESPTEQRIADLFADVLKKDRVGRNDSFFDLGGHSLLAIRLLGRISKTFGIRLQLRALFDAPTVAKLAVVLEPKSGTETTLTAIWNEVLKKEPIGLHQSFFDLGGHSLLAIRLLGRISKAFGVRLPLKALFDAPTVRQLAATIDRMTLPKEDEIDSLLEALGKLDPADAARLLDGEFPGGGAA